ncbi:Curved DNA-binding protein [subsurface metagenome]
MVTKSRARQVKRALRNTDDILYILTGKRLRKVVGKVVNLYGEELAKKASKLFTGPEEEELPPDSPYFILGVHPDAMNIVVKGAYRALAREYHPDTGTKPDVKKFQAATEAYDAIMKERKATAEAKE